MSGAADERAIAAARNNALWCDAVCRAHSAPGEFHPALWLNRHAVPRFYSNAITLTPNGAAGQRARIDALAAERASFSAKDSFAALDLRPLGFDVLFEATWLWRDSARPAESEGDLTWARVETVVDLARWEATWAGLHPGQTIPDTERIFPPALLAEPGVVFMAGRREGEIAAVAVANATDAVVGISNVFAPAEAAAMCWAGVVVFAGRLFPGRPLVGYERGDDLLEAQRAGFRPIGELRVWAR